MPPAPPIRYTPTCVGKRSAAAPLVVALYGTPPRAWGRGLRLPARLPRDRYTPTCVGKSSPGPRRPTPQSVHPHVRGEEPKMVFQPGKKYGTPPRAWGRVDQDLVPVGVLRYTPTCVGKRPTRRTGSPPRAVHPHVRGEEILPSHGSRAVSGTPPRAWGRAVVHLSRVLDGRYTPTCVGKSPTPARRTARTSVHPHVRGEEELRSRRITVPNGTPPRAWGRGTIGVSELRRSRYTPTCVGKSLAQGHWGFRNTVHPHVRGEEPSPFTPNAAPSGTPPRAWGRGHAHRRGAGHARYTPTCVGKRLNSVRAMPFLRFVPRTLRSRLED